MFNMSIPQGHCLLALLEQYGGADNYRERLAVNPGLSARVFGLVYVTREQRAGAPTSYIHTHSSQVLEQVVLESAFPTNQALVDIGQLALAIFEGENTD